MERAMDSGIHIWNQELGKGSPPPVICRMFFILILFQKSRKKQVGIVPPSQHNDFACSFPVCV